MDRRGIGRGLGWALAAVIVAAPAVVLAQVSRPEGPSAGVQRPQPGAPPASRGWDRDRGDRGDRDRGRDLGPGWRPYAWDRGPGWYDPYYRPPYPYYPPPAPVWVPGQWVWNGYQWVWYPGHWRYY